MIGEGGIISQAEIARQHQANAEASDNEALSDYDKMIANATAGDSGSENQESLGISYTIEDIDVSGKAVILRYRGAYASYNEYAEQILEGKKEEEIVRIFIEEENRWREQLGRPAYADIYELIEDWYGEELTIEEFCQYEGYNNMAEMVIDYEYVELEGYQGANVASIAKNGTHEVTGIESEFIATRNGTYTVKATTKDGRQAEVQVNVTGIVEEKFSTIYEETTLYTEGTKTAKIPAGFAVGISEGINTIEDGLVITDAVDSEGYSIGNEFVWIPVEANQFERQNLSNLSTTYWPKYTEPLKYTENEITYTGYENEETEYNTMRTQVLEHKGFYIGRYEAGINTATLRMEGTSGALDVINKRGVAPYNHVPWGASTTDINSGVGTIQTKGAVYLSKNMYKNSDSVTSTLVYGIQWDAMCKYIGEEEYNYKQEYEYGVKLTGSVMGDEAKNIYNLSGNCREWTMEGYGKSGRTLRGGDYVNNRKVCERDNGYLTVYSYPINLGFRTAIYIN